MRKFFLGIVAGHSHHLLPPFFPINIFPFTNLWFLPGISPHSYPHQITLQSSSDCDRDKHILYFWSLTRVNGIVVVLAQNANQSGLCLKPFRVNLYRFCLCVW